MHRAAFLAGPFVLAAAASALADEYTVTETSGLWIPPPRLATADDDAQAAVSTPVIEKRVDGDTRTITLPFPFAFFGTAHTQVSVADDGWLAFGATGVVVGDNPELRERAAPNAVVAALWDDLRTTKRGPAEQGAVVRFVKGVAPTRTFVVAWQRMDTAAGSTTADVSFEVLLHEGTGVVEIAYAPTGAWNGLTYTAGIENETGTRAFGGPNTDSTNTGRPESDLRFTPNGVVVSGTITRARPTASSSGLDFGNLETGLPVAGARVELVREGASSRTVAASALTDESGVFHAMVLGLDGEPSLAVDLLAAGAESHVTDTDGKTWTRRIATGVVPAGSPSIGVVHLDGTTINADPNFMKTLNVQQAAHRGYLFARAAAATSPTATDAFPDLEFRWVPAGGTASAYTAATSTTAARATISDVGTNPDAYDDDIVLREYGQHVLASIAAFPSGSAPHAWNVAVTSESIAFLDGFSFWFACAVNGRSTFLDTTPPAPTNPNPNPVFDLETQTPPVTVPAGGTAPSGALVPGAVAASLWDLVDDASEAGDSFAGALPDSAYDVLLTLDQRRRAASLPTTAVPWTPASFVAQFLAGGPAADREAAARVFIRYRTLPDDKSEPNDVAAETTTFPSVPAHLTDLVLNPFNEDRFSFSLGAQPLSVAASFVEATGVEVSILDGTGAVLATASNVPGLKSPVVVTTPAGLAPGAYVARVAWKSGPAAHYTLGIASRPTLVTTSLPETTAQEPFNQVLVVTGGLAPVTFTVKPSLPEGLSLVSADGRITGRPTTPGVFPLEIVASDASGSGPQTAGTLELRVNPALDISRFFGLAAGSAAVDAEIGRGGTLANFVPVKAPPAGFTVTGGTALRITAGAAGDPQAFDVSATATDSVGASLQDTVSHVVVSKPFFESDGTVVPKETRFGFFVDTLKGGRATFDLTFAGGGSAPILEAVVDDLGTEIDVDGRVQRRGGHVRIVNVPVERTGKIFVLFKSDDPTRVSAARGRVRPPTRFSGVANIATPATTAESRFTAVAGSRARIVVQSAAVPDAAKPGTVTITGPGGVPVTMPAGRSGSDGRRETFSGVALPATGEYVLRIAGDGQTTGPLVFQIDVTPPRK